VLLRLPVVAKPVTPPSVFVVKSPLEMVGFGGCDAKLAALAKIVPAIAAMPNLIPRVPIIAMSRYSLTSA